MISSFHIRTHCDQESLEPIEKNHHAAKNLNKEADGEKTAIAVGEVISEAVAEEISVADSPSKIHILEGAKHKSIKDLPLGNTISLYRNNVLSLRGYTPVMQLVTPRAVAMAVRIEMAV